jgi:hypothetical protein
MSWKAFYDILGKSKDKYQFYDGDYSYEDFNVNDKLAGRFKGHIGWAARAVDIRSNKTKFDKFENDTMGFNDILDKYQIREALDLISDDILICGVGFLALAGDVVMPFTAEEATGIYDWRSKNLKNGIAVYRSSSAKKSTNKPDSYIEYYGNKTIAVNGEKTTIMSNHTGRPLIGMLTHRPSTKQPFGRSVISQKARDAITSASRTNRQMEIAGYHYNSKVRVILGVDNETEVDKVEMQTGDALKISTNENGQIPQIGEFAQHAMAPFNDEILSFAKNFCADTKLSLANLSMSTSAPRSAEELEIASDDLADDIAKWHRNMGEQLKYFVTTLWLYENNVSELDENLMAKIREIKPVWKPILRIDVAKVGDGISKLAQLVPEILKTRSIWRRLGLTSDEIDKIVDDIIPTTVE